MSATRDQIAAAITALGDTPLTVADRLMLGGHRGHVAAARRCPVAVYLQAVCGTSTVIVGCDGVAVLDGGQIIDVDLTEAVVAFVYQFDMGLHPDLCPAPEPVVAAHA
jgi:hypothetical protein